MLDRSLTQQFPHGTGAILAMLVVMIILAQSFAAAAATNTGKALSLCKTEIAVLTDSKARVKLDRVRGSKLRLRVRMPGERSQRVWCQVQEGAVQLATPDGKPFPKAAGNIAPKRTKSPVADNA